MKLILIGLTLLSLNLLTATVALAQEWQWVSPLPQGNTLNDIAIVNSQIGWAAGDAGTVMHTTDGGEHWTILPVPAEMNLPLRKIYFTDANNGWLLSETSDFHPYWSSLFATTDAGVSWSRADSAVGTPDIDFSFSDVQHGYRIGRGWVARTTDGGLTWQRRDTIGIVFTSCYFADSLTGWIGATEARILHTTDGGATWSQQTLSNNFLITRIGFVDSLHGWLGGSGGGFYRTEDGGATWNWMDGGGGDILFANIQDGWAVSGAGIRRTTDSGTTWFEWAETPMNQFVALACTDSESVWAAGRAGAIVNSHDAGVTWSWQAGTSCVSYSGLTFPDPRHGWLMKWVRWPSVDTTQLLHTTDGGATWGTQMTNSSALSIDNPVFFDSLHGLAGSYDTQGEGLAETTDSGESWNVVQRDSLLAERIAMQFVTPQIGWLTTIGDDNGWAIAQVWGTRDGGAHWNLQLTYAPMFGFRARLDILTFADTLNGWAALSNEWVLYHTRDGLNWEQIPQPGPGVYIYQMCAVGSACWLACREYGGLWCTTNHGQSWTQQDTRFTYGVHMADALNGWASTDRGILHTPDGGQHWVLDDLALGSPVTFASTGSNNIWAVGYNSTILHYSTGLWSHNPPFNLRPSSFTLSAYPNPFNLTTVVSFDVPTRSRVELKVYDLTGRLVQTLTDQIYDPGAHRIDFNGSTLSSGIYFARLQTPGFSRTQKLVLLK